MDDIYKRRADEDGIFYTVANRNRPGPSSASATRTAAASIDCAMHKYKCKLENTSCQMRLIDGASHPTDPIYLSRSSCCFSEVKKCKYKCEICFL